MAEIDGQILLMAVQAVQEQIRRLHAQINRATEDDDVTDEEDLLMGYEKAADALRLACEAEALISSNSPMTDGSPHQHGGRLGFDSSIL